MKQYSKVINDELVIKPANDIKVTCNGFVLLTPTESDILNDGWSLYSQDQEDIDLEISLKRNEVIKQILEYDSSDNVNIFYKNDTAMWLDKSTRTSLKFRFELELENGKDTTILWYNGTPFYMTVREALSLLNLIEEYAIKSYDVTQTHIFNVNNISDIEELEKYNFKSNYPPILHL